ncbi:hypothetical protein BKA81DRAFT_414742 [Phyllosticta paracitricarpa]|uniref:Uncharacterized protein n=1 Tax=Phyllosticta paracitricarpa TaxID=2016321 RepID=A0ABR1MZ70_9PEZI
MDNNPYGILGNLSDQQSSSPEGQNSSPEGQQSIHSSNGSPAVTRFGRIIRQPERLGSEQAQTHAQPEAMELDSPVTTRAGRVVHEPYRFSTQQFPKKPSPKRTATDAIEKEGQSKKLKPEQDEGYDALGPQPGTSGYSTSGGTSGTSGTGNGGSYDFGLSTAEDRERRWRGNAGGEQPTGQNQEKTRNQKGKQNGKQKETREVKEIKGGTIIYGRHLSKFLNRHATAEERRHIATIPDKTSDKVYCKRRYHIVLRVQKNHVITVPLYSKGKEEGLNTSDPIVLAEYLMVVRSDYQGTANRNQTAHSMVLQVAQIFGPSRSKFMADQNSVSWAHFLEPHSVDKDWELQVVGELEPQSYDQLMNSFADFFTIHRGRSQAQLRGGYVQITSQLESR